MKERGRIKNRFLKIINLTESKGNKIAYPVGTGRGILNWLIVMKDISVVI
jgi:hypothetical protein